jgi:hypothetical protein
MAKFTITFETDADVTANDINMLLTTQLNVYCATREPVESYVAKRYAEQTEEFRARKLESLSRLLQTAHDMNETKEILGQ